MIDGFGRSIDYLRISVTDRCNLRCVYCMPPEGVEWMDHEEMLSYEEIIRLCSLFAQVGIRKVRLTGGEPLARRDLPELVRGIHAIDGIESIALTTNGLLLQEQLPALLDAGLTAVNLSLDTLDQAQYAAITRRDALDQALSGLYAALEAPGLRVKLNCVPMGRTTRSWSPWPTWPGSMIWRCGISSSCPSVWAAPSPAGQRRRSAPCWRRPSAP